MARPTSAQGHGKIVRLEAGRAVRARPQIFPASYAKQSLINGPAARLNSPICFRPSLKNCSARGGVPTSRWTERHKNIARSRAGDVRGSLLQPPELHHAASRSDIDRARGRLRREFGRQRQGARMTPFQERLYPIGGRRRRGRDRRGLRGLAQVRAASAHFVMDHAYWGPQLRRADIDGLIMRQGEASRIAEVAEIVETQSRRTDLCRNDGGGRRRRQSRRLVPGAHGMGPARAGQSLHRLRPAPRRHEGDPEREDQAARVVSSLRAVGAFGGACPTGSKRTTPSPS